MRLCEKCYVLREDYLFLKLRGFNKEAPSVGLKWCRFCQKTYLMGIRGKNSTRLTVTHETITVTFD